MSLVQLIYVSSEKRPLSDDELDKILESCVRQNTLSGVTGMLLYSEGNFLQVLEGSEAAIEETYQRICQDARHTNFFLLSKEEIPQREFSAWQMGFRRLSKLDAKNSPDYAPLFENGFDPQQLTTQSGLAAEMMREFCYLNADQNSTAK
jgi:hypothetical protein